MMGPADALQRFTYELPHVVALGPTWSAIVAGFAVADWRGRVYLTPAGQRYLDSLETS